MVDKMIKDSETEIKTFWCKECKLNYSAYEEGCPYCRFRRGDVEMAKECPKCGIKSGDVGEDGKIAFNPKIGMNYICIICGHEWA